MKKKAKKRKKKKKKKRNKSKEEVMKNEKKTLKPWMDGGCVLHLPRFFFWNWNCHEYGVRPSVFIHSKSKPTLENQPSKLIRKTLTREKEMKQKKKKGNKTETK